MNKMSRKEDKAARSAAGQRTPNAFGALDALGGLPTGPEASAPVVPIKTSKNFKGIDLAEKQDLAKKIQKSCGVGGTVKDGNIEIQGDKRDEVKRILTEAGFSPIFAGG
jgi:hypothetical protein